MKLEVCSEAHLYITVDAEFWLRWIFLSRIWHRTRLQSGNVTTNTSQFWTILRSQPVWLKRKYVLWWVQGLTKILTMNLSGHLVFIQMCILQIHHLLLACVRLGLPLHRQSLATIKSRQCLLPEFCTWRSISFMKRSDEQQQEMIKEGGISYEHIG